MQRKVDVMNGRVPQVTPKKDSVEVKKNEESAPKKVKQEDYAKRMLIMLLFVITVTMGYILEDGPFKIWALGITVVAVFHVYALWVAFWEKRISDSTIMLAKVWFGIVILGVFFPTPMWQAWEQTKNTVIGLNQPYSKVSAVADDGESQQEEGMWMLFDPDIYTLAEHDGIVDPESIFIDDPETWVQLPEVPKGFEAVVACGSASMKIYWTGGPKYGQEVLCKGLVLRDLKNLIITVAPVTEDGEVISVRLKPIKKMV